MKKVLAILTCALLITFTIVSFADEKSTATQTTKQDKQKAKEIYVDKILDFECKVSGTVKFDSNGNQTVAVIIANLKVKNKTIDIIKQEIGKDGIGFIETKQLGKIKVEIIDPLASTQKVLLWGKNEPSKKETKSDAKEGLYVEKEISMGMFGMQKIRTHKQTGKTGVYDANNKWSPITITPEGKITLPQGTQLLTH